MDMIRIWLRQWLGLNAVATIHRVEVLETCEKQRHAEILAYLDRIEKRMIAGHVDQPREFTPAVLDWDTVQAIALHNLEKNPEN